MELRDVAELQVLLEGVELPAKRDELIRYAVGEGASSTQLGMLRQLREDEYETIDELAEELVSVQPEREHEAPPPREESGAPPGGEDYTQSFPESGAVRA